MHEGLREGLHTESVERLRKERLRYAQSRMSAVVRPDVVQMNGRLFFRMNAEAFPAKNNETAQNGNKNNAATCGRFTFAPGPVPVSSWQSGGLQAVLRHPSGD